MSHGNEDQSKTGPKAYWNASNPDLDNGRGLTWAEFRTYFKKLEGTWCNPLMGPDLPAIRIEVVFDSRSPGADRIRHELARLYREVLETIQREEDQWRSESS